MLFHNPMKKGNFRLTCPKERWRLVPKRKSLFYAPEGKGLAIGNLSSQFWANVYMNVFDQWVSRTFKKKVLYWQRYVDDALFLAEDKEALSVMPKMIDEFLHENLGLRLNPKKTLLQPLAKGLDHLGYFHKGGGMQIRRAVVGRAKFTIEKMLSQVSDDSDLESLCATIGSYLGHYRQGDGFRLRRSLLKYVSSGEAITGKITSDPDYTKAKLLTRKRRQDHLVELDLAMQNEFLSDFEPLKRGVTWENFHKPA